MPQPCLELLPADPRRAIVAGIAAVAAVTLWCLLLNVVVFPEALPPGYREFFTSPLWPRTPLHCLYALRDELTYRLLIMTTCAMIGAVLFGRVSPAWIAMSILVAQALNVWPELTHFGLYGALYFLTPGLVWGWIYWRHGWIAAAVAHSTVHLALDPLLLWMM